MKEDGVVWFRPPLGGRCRLEAGAPKRSGCRLKPAFPSRVLCEWVAMCDFDRLSAVDAGWKPALRSAAGAGPHRENWPEVGVPVPGAP